MECKTIGIILSVKKQWWLKVNTKPVRMHAFDGATFPHIVTVKYTVDGNEIEGCIVPVAGDGKTHQVEVVLG